MEAVAWHDLLQLDAKAGSGRVEQEWVVTAVPEIIFSVHLRLQFVDSWPSPTPVGIEGQNE